MTFRTLLHFSCSNPPILLLFFQFLYSGNEKVSRKSPPTPQHHRCRDERLLYILIYSFAVPLYFMLKHALTSTIMPTPDNGGKPPRPTDNLSLPVQTQSSKTSSPNFAYCLAPSGSSLKCSIQLLFLFIAISFYLWFYGIIILTRLQ